LNIDAGIGDLHRDAPKKEIFQTLARSTFNTQFDHLE
jgi:hypothetical protein